MLPSLHVQQVGILSSALDRLLFLRRAIGACAKALIQEAREDAILLFLLVRSSSDTTIKSYDTIGRAVASPFSGDGEFGFDAVAPAKVRR